ncbi:glycosyltransferase family 2 protein [Haladaptatus sp. NG-SE-30]
MQTISVIIATKDRLEDLKRCVHSIGNQTHPPIELIIVDDGGIEPVVIDEMRESLPADTDLIHTESNGPPGLSVARNTGIRKSNGNIILVLDDDAEIGESYLSRVANWFDRVDDPNFVGLAGFDNRLRTYTKAEKIFRRVFLLEEGEWKINKAGIQSRSIGIDSPTKADWMPGYNFAYRREVIVNHLFPQYNGGREALEDIAVGWELKKEGKYSIIDPELPVRHFDPPKQDSGYTIGVKHGRNRLRYFRKYGNLRHSPLFVWVMIGVIMLELVSPFTTRRFRFHWRKAMGIIVGLSLQLLTKGENPVR